VTTARIGVQLQPQHCTTAELRAAWSAADELGVDSIWTWDHLEPHTGDPAGPHFECWTLLAALAADTRRARIGSLVCCAAWRNPDLLAEMARTVDHLSEGRLVLGLGAGWFEREFDNHGYRFGSAAERLDVLEEVVQRIRHRLDSGAPAPAGPLPLLIGGQGERRTLELVARYADGWNCYGWEAASPAENFAAKSRALDGWCERVGRDPAEIERSVMLDPGNAQLAGEVADAGADEIVITIPAPFSLEPVEAAIAAGGGSRPHAPAEAR
jgi:probable F420-dependent oxidoreductase